MPLEAQQLLQRDVRHVELVVRRLAGREEALELDARPPEGARQRVPLVPGHPREDLHRRAQRDETRDQRGERLTFPAGGAQQEPRADVRQDQRGDQVGAAAGVFAVGLAQRPVVDRPTLEGGDALVLGAVVARQLRVAHGEEDGQQRGAGDGELTVDRRAPPRRGAAPP